ncbi:MAG: hypothetical protein HYZ22_12285 [Chloroflexi bacterium]|nr:hypothetical protein [Chloroflexota bacterium]
MTKHRLILSLCLILILTACAAPASPAPTQTSTPKPPAATATIDNSTPTLTVTPDAAMGTMEGKITWLFPGSTDSPPVPDVTFQLDRHNGEYLKYKVRSEADGYYVFANIEPGEYGVGIYLNLRLNERRCDAPEFDSSEDLEWSHYSTWSKVDVWYDVIFSNVDIIVKPGETVMLDFQLECP